MFVEAKLAWNEWKQTDNYLSNLVQTSRMTQTGIKGPIHDKKMSFKTMHSVELLITEYCSNYQNSLCEW